MQRHVVIDTNSLLQILGAHSKFLDEEFVLCISNDILLEYEEILKAKASPLAADLFLKTIVHSQNVLRKDPYYRLNLISSDPDDNKFVDCAFACQAEYVVTDDTHFSILKTIPFPVIFVKSLDKFCEDYPDAHSSLICDDSEI